jgi:ankyrin repeat protein
MMLSMSWSTVALLCLLSGSWLLASEGQKPSYPSFDYETARDHEIKPHRQTIPVDGIGQAWPGLHMLRLKLTVSPTGDVTHAEVIGEVEDARFWPQAEGEVYQWKFTPFKAGGKPVTTTVEERVELLPPERLPKKHVPPPAITKDSKVAITLEQWTVNCPFHTVTVSTDEIVFRGFGEVVAQGRHTDKIEKDAVIALAKRFAAADFYSMEDDYRWEGGILSSSLSITIDGHTKIVRDYDGPWVGMPAVILELEDEVDAVARTERWIKGGEGLVAALRTEKFNFASYDSQLIMETAAVYGQTATVRELLAAGVPIKPLPAPKIDNPYGGPFEEVQLLTAASRYPDTLQVFLDLGASKDDQREKDRALDGAARAGKLEAVRALIAYGANPNVDFMKMCNASVGVNVAAVDCEGLGSVLISAARSGNPELVKEILRYGPKLETREQNGKTALFVAGESTKSDEDGERVECVRMLAKAGASVDARDRWGNTLLHGGYLLDVDEELLKLGADVNARNHEGETPIFTNRNVRVIPLFLQHGADLTIRNNHGETVIEAQKGRGPDWDEALRKATAEVEHPQ